jgi:membrane-bound ClpP family serine protease
MAMRNLLFWFLYSLFAATGLVMILLGFLFFRSMVTSSSIGGACVFTLLLFSIILLLTGGGLLFSTIAESVRRFSRRY